MKIKKQITHINDYALFLYETAIKVILFTVIIALLITMSWMALKLIFVLRGLMGGDIKEVLKTVILNVLMIFAILEIYKTTLAYFAEGRVKVTYIIDTVLVVVLTEVMAFWFKEVEYPRLVMVIALVLTLIVARILAIRFSPTKEKEMDKQSF